MRVSKKVFGIAIAALLLFVTFPLAAVAIAPGIAPFWLNASIAKAELSVTSGETYRLRCLANVTKDGVSESVSFYSEEKTA